MWKIRVTGPTGTSEGPPWVTQETLGGGGITSGPGDSDGVICLTFFCSWRLWRQWLQHR